MKVLFFLALAVALAWTAFVVFANMMKPSESSGFLGGNTLVVAWLIVGVLGAAMAVG
jgi:hypothetical protein